MRRGEWAMRILCDSENVTGNEAHHANRSSFDWIMVEGRARWFCEDCRYEIEKIKEDAHG
jgi:mannose-6-phosphate isomerase-like protein (cupin superfamily)